MVIEKGGKLEEDDPQKSPATSEVMKHGAGNGNL
jgi:hypothetical protein